MRCILALLIVFMHSFTCYNGSWEQPVGFVDIPAYKWLTRISFAFTLEAFVFISGYLTAFQRFTLRRNATCKSVVYSKFRRLFIPSILFSAAYFALFFQYKGVGDLIYNIINGCGHMWFLPMLFWCYICGWILEQVKINDCCKMAFLIVINLFTIITLPLRFSDSLSFMMYFYGGFLCYKYSDTIKSYARPTVILFLWLLFVLLFILLRPLRDVLVTQKEWSVYLKLTVYVCKNACQLLYATTGLMAFYLTTVFYTKRHQIRPFTVRLATYCFGIYLFQQFILQLLYYKTALPSLVGPYWLPWCGFAIATVASGLFSDILLRTRVGRYLIG